ncbi:MAG: carboxypeptidase regulatory-like domain-containing protein [Acidimicrobiales bacterium]
MSITRGRLLGIATVAALALLAPPTAGPAGASITSLPVWGSVVSPNVGELANSLSAVDGSGPADVWAVGEWNPGVPPTATGRRTLALHFDGASWTVTPTPNAAFEGVDLTALEGVASFAANDAWAVGHGDDFASLRSETVALHWDGAAWSRVATPNPAGTSLPNRLFSIDGVAADDIWAVGGVGFPARALVLRYDGTAWTRVRAPGKVELHGVFATAADDVWAVGGGVVIHWNGTSWTQVRIPRDSGDQLEDVSATGPNDVWVAGKRAIASGEHVTFAPVVLHWDGVRWTRVLIVPGLVYDGVHAVGPDDVWVAGTTTNGLPLLAHFDGSAGFEPVPTPAPNGDGGALDDLNGVAGGELFAVGVRFEGDQAIQRTLILEAPSSTQGQVIGDTNVGFASVAWFGETSGSTETDASGGFFAPGLPAGDYTFVVSNAGCDPAVVGLSVAAGESITQSFTVVC